MTPDQFVKRVQNQLLKIERETLKLHNLLQDGVNAWRPEMEALGVDVTPYSGGLPKPDPQDEK